jgi:esterase/lipase superfamily enzyme
MQEETIQHYSYNLDLNIEIKAYGHYGFALMLFPALVDSPSVYEENGTIELLKPFIEKGKCRVFCVPSFNQDSWFNAYISHEEKSKLHYDYNNFIIDEAVPLIFDKCGGPVPLICAGASIGGYHAMNSFLRRPDMFYGAIALSGFFNIEYISGNYFDENCYFNSPIHYLPNLNDSYWLSFLLSKRHIYLYSGSGENEFPENTLSLSKLLDEKDIRHECEILGSEYGHDFESWNKMFFHIMNTKL